MGAIDALLEAAGQRSMELDAEAVAVKEALAALDADISSKRAERTIAAQEAVRELLKSKEAKMKRQKLVEAALGHVRLALAKLEQTQAVGLDDWRELRKSTLPLSAFATERVKDDEVMSGLKAACAGGTLSSDGAKLSFTGSAKGLESLKEALEKLESGYSCSVEVEASMLRLLETRGELERLAKKHGVAFASKGESLVEISGAAEKASKAEKLFRWLLTGRADLPCPRALVNPAKAQAKEVEMETGAFIDVSRQGTGFGGGSTIQIRGDSECVKEAQEQMRHWLDEKEGKCSVFVEVEILKKLEGAKAQDFENDLWQFGQHFGIEATHADGVVELRGPSDLKWEDAARKELSQVTSWYAQQVSEAAAAKAKAKAKAAPAPEPDDEWGAAPEAEFELGHRW